MDDTPEFVKSERTFSSCDVSLSESLKNGSSETKTLKNGDCCVIL